VAREDGKGTCEHCGATFSYYLVHNGFNDSTYAYCDTCGRTAILSLSTMEERIGKLPRLVVPIPNALEQHLVSCGCGGRFRAAGVPRCPACRESLSPESATTWIEGNAPGARHGWRWQRSWHGLYAIVIGENEVFDPWVARPAG
jgi:hypothetical protein